MLKNHNPISIAILGAGISGICMAIKLKKAGFDDIQIYEKSDDIGGTWNDNSYPGCSCDVPMHMYEYSFAMSPHWTKKFVLADEIKTYLDGVIDRFHIRPLIKLNHEITQAHFNEAKAMWSLTLKNGKTIHANIFIAGSGQLHFPSWPHIEGRQTFQKPHWHSAVWNHNVALKNKKVGVIGNGASAIQFVPEIVKQIGDKGELTLFQRSASWVLPRPQRHFYGWEKWLYRLFPPLMKLQRYKIYWQGELLWLAFHKQAQKLKTIAIETMKSDLKDEHKQKQLTPDYEPGCKRVLFANDWWQAMAQNMVKIITTPIEKITAQGVKTQDEMFDLDILIYSTGFDTTNFLSKIKMTGLGNHDLKDVWQKGANAHLGMTIHGFPNFFMLYGPNTNLGHNSIIFMIECQANYITQCVKQLRDRDWLYMDVKKSVQEKSNQKVQADNASSVFASGCTSWYKTKDGVVTNNWANHTYLYWWKTRKPKKGDFHYKNRHPLATNIGVQKARTSPA